MEGWRFCYYYSEAITPSHYFCLFLSALPNSNCSRQGGKALAGSLQWSRLKENIPQWETKGNSFSTNCLRPSLTPCCGGLWAEPGTCSVLSSWVSFLKLPHTLPVPFNEVHLGQIPLAKEQVSAVFKDVFNLVWPEEQSAVQFDILFCKTHTVGSRTLLGIGQHAGNYFSGTKGQQKWVRGWQWMHGPMMDEW